MQFLRSILFTTVFFAVTAIYGVIELCIGVWLPYDGRWAIARSWAWLNLTLLKLICNLRFEVEGTENIPAEPGIALWKHSSTWETIAQAWILPKQVWVFKRELLWIPIVGWALRLMQPIAINRSGGGNALRQVVTQGKERMASGCWIVIFPEGTRMKVGETRRYGLSGAVLAVETGRKIIPIAHTAGYFWPRRGWLKKPGVIKVVVGKPVEAAGRQPQEINNEIQAWMEKTVSEKAPG
ncbi:MAG TPA: lysophospholipid acyltransferase family protein [Steroidobacteraceae bacterium]|nr:lysophospholipid acyltransferase family protein [Steroidobacteraceae bacterium]